MASPVGRQCGVGDVASRLARALPAEFEPTLVDLPTRASRGEWCQVNRLARSCDVVHVHFENGLFQVLRPLRNRLGTLLAGIGDRTIVSLHGPLPELVPRWPRWRTPRDLVRDLAYFPFFARWEKAQYRRARHWVTHTRVAHERARRTLPRDRLSLLPLPVPQVADRWRYAPAEPLQITTPGFVKPNKGYELLLEVLGRLPTWRWVIAGGPQDDRDRLYLDQLRQAIEHAGLGSRIEITGYRPAVEVERELARATVVVLPFHTTTASASLAWAVGCGAPVVAARLRPFVEVAEAGAGVELVEGRDPDTWTRCLTRLAAEPSSLELLSARNLRYAQGHGDETTAGRYADLYAGLHAGLAAGASR